MSRDLSPHPGREYTLRKAFDTDQYAQREGYVIEENQYRLHQETIPRKKGYLRVNVTTRTERQGWMRIRIKIPVMYGEPWISDLKKTIEHELRHNYDLIGVFLNDVDLQWFEGFDLSWEE
ncbi:MAG: hypothetical protein HXS47_11615 [Theionarchaea archaeon]|nr:hypothetical protein [Theionarchaea archaeon]